MQRFAHGVAVTRAFSVVLLTALAACNQKATFTPPPPPKVTVARPLIEPIQEEATFTGQTAALLSVDLVARVAGFLQEANFLDGADVQKGQVLFMIEPDQYQAQVELAQATIDQHQALLKSAEAELERQTTLQKQFVSTQANYDKALADRDSERAAVAEAQANLKTAQINLGYTKIEAPFSGRIGRRLVDPGSLVGSGGATKLATISQLDKIYVYFTINERDIPRLLQAMRDRGLSREALQTVPVFAGLSGEAGTPIQGHFDFIDPVMDATTGTLQARAVFDNSKNQLIPGLFVRLRIPLGTPKPTPMVPEAAVSADQVGSYVLIVEDKDTVALRRVGLGASQNGLRAISSGVTASDRIIIDGLQNATPGRTVTVQAGKVASAAPTGP